MMKSEQISGVTNLSAPVIGPLGSVMAVITSPYTERLDRDCESDRLKVIEMVHRAAATLSQDNTQT